MPLFCWIHHSRAEIVKFFCWYFGRNDDTKGHFEINWPLAQHLWIKTGSKLLQAAFKARCKEATDRYFLSPILLSRMDQMLKSMGLRSGEQGGHIPFKSFSTPCLSPIGCVCWSKVHAFCFYKKRSYKKR